MNASFKYIFHSGKNSKFLFYLKAVMRELVPDSWTRQRLQKEMEMCTQLYDENYIASRVDYYCKLMTSTKLGPAASRIGDLHKKGHNSTYYYDSREIIRWFDSELRWNYLFGDIRDIPPYPTIVKSRSLTPDNANSVLLKLDKCRHFVYVNDKIPFTDKQDRVIFRGQVGTRENRIRFIQQFANDPRVDAANTLANGGLLADNPDGKTIVPRMSLYEHLDYKYIMALEGNDVASNLKWVMSSNSLAVMPRPTCETWFMEGLLQGGVHYVEIKDDYSDLHQQLDYYTAHPQEAEKIAANAQHFVSQFRDERRERYIALRVMQKYFSLCQQ